MSWYFVTAMAVFRDGYEEVVRRLTGGLQFMSAWHKEWVVPTTGANSQARDRLGEAPLKTPFERVAVPLAVAGTPGAWPGKRRLMAINGVKLDVPDIPVNIEGFGRPGGLTRRPFPQIQVAALGEFVDQVRSDRAVQRRGQAREPGRRGGPFRAEQPHGVDPLDPGQPVDLQQVAFAMPTARAWGIAGVR